MATKANDLVISYIVHPGMVDAKTYEPLQNALDEGYRVADVIQTAVNRE